MTHARRLEAVVLDFDHTLTDFGDHVRWADARPALRAAYQEAGVSAGFLDAHAGSLSLYAAVASEGALDGQRLAAAQARASALLDQYEGEAVATTLPLPGAAELSAALPRLGLRAAIVTSNAASVTRAILEQLELAGAFAVVIGRSEVARLKPNPEGLLAACRALGVERAVAVYVGDSVGDIEAARAAGMVGWGVLTGHGSAAELGAARAEAVFATLGDVLARLNELDAVTARGA